MALEQLSFNFEDKKSEQAPPAAPDAPKANEDQQRMAKMVERLQKEEGHDPKTAREIAKLSLRSIKHEEQQMKGSRRTEVMEQKDPHLH